jgi:cellulose synthase/poly-beta-1,6-N-acetylglucosamine synthase-like glycosyltransferase
MTVPSLLLYITRACVLERPTSFQLFLDGDHVPTVDILITACNEENDVIVNSARAACQSDWPEDKFRVVVTDDGRNQELARQILQLQARYPWLYYTSREKPKILDYKAGNLNHALTWTAALEPETSELIAGLDADMIVQPQWLRKMVPHLLQTEELAMVCAPQ